jgi:ribosomal protein S18 acetylase RimI-like enzyme
MTAAYEPVYDNLREAMLFFGQATGRGEIRAVPQGTAIYSGIEYGVFNICFLDPFPEDAARSLDACAMYFSRHSRRWSLWVCEEALTAEGLRTLRGSFDKHGLREISRAPGMTAVDLAPPRRELPAIVCTPVETQKHRETFGAMAALCFDIPMGVAREVYYPDHGWHGSYRGFIGVVAGRPVGIVALVKTGGSVGVYSLAIQPESRRLGYGEALLRAAVDHARAAGGVERIVLQSSESGASLYRHMGFRDVAKFTVYLTK